MQTAEKIDRALAAACAKRGFCTTLSGDSLLKKYNGKITPHDFAASLHYAEGLNFEYSRHTKVLEAIFRKYVTES